MGVVGNVFAGVLGPARVAELRDGVSTIWRRLFAAAGRYRPIPPEETAVALEQRISFKGDVPRQISEGAHEQGRMAFCIPRPAFEEAAGIVVTPNGGAWRDACFEERYSAGRPGLRMLLENRRADETLPEAVVIQCAHNDTYGDWVSEYLVPILRAAPLTAPLLLPAQIAAKSFVARDLAALGVDWRAIEKPLGIEKATVLRQKKFFVHFTEEEVRLLRAVFSKPDVPAHVGGIVYLSRYGERSNVAERRYPSLVIENIVNSRGGRVIRTASSSQAEYAAAAADAETVIFDHGSAFYNAAGWPARRVVEIVSDDWWNNAFVMFANAAGIDDYTIIRGDHGDGHVERMLNEVLDAALDAALDAGAAT